MKSRKELTVVPDLRRENMIYVCFNILIPPTISSQNGNPSGAINVSFLASQETAGNIHRQITDQEGRYIILDISTNDIRMTIVMFMVQMRTIQY
jgi:hypothetical protein